MKKVSISEASLQTGIPEQTLRVGLRNNRFPFGTAVKTSASWTYIIHPILLKKYLDGDLPYDQSVKHVVCETNV